MNEIWGTIPDWVSVLIALLSFIGFVMVERNRLFPRTKRTLPISTEKITPTETIKEKLDNQLSSNEAGQDEGRDWECQDPCVNGANLKKISAAQSGL